MKKFYVSLLSLILAFGILAGCNQEETSPSNTESKQSEPQTNEEVEETVSITISIDNGNEELAQEEVTIEEGALLLDVLKENFDVEVTEEGYITSIEGVTQDEGDHEGKWWMYEVNGEFAEVGAAEFELNAEDKVVFDLHGME